MESLKYIDLFAGCGGLSLGLHLAGWKGLFAIEKSKDAFSTLKYNLIENSQHFEWVDWLPKEACEIGKLIEDYKSHLIDLRGKVDMVVGGPPCQGFSTAGRRVEGDVRNGLVKSYLDFVDLVRPKIIFFENVKGFTLKFKKNMTIGAIYANFVEEQLRQIGYDIKGQMVNFADYGIPQKRVRFILVGIRKDIVAEKKVKADDFFALLQDTRSVFLSKKGINSTSTTLEQAISDLLRSHGEIDTPDRFNFKSGKYGNPSSAYQALMRKDCHKKVPDSHSFAKHRDDISNRFALILQKCERSKKVDSTLLSQFNISKHTIIPLNEASQTPTLTTLPDDFIHYSEPRILTVREYARIQSFPDWFEFKGKYTTGGKQRVKEVPRYTQIGNAIPPLFGEQTGLALKTLLQNG